MRHTVPPLAALAAWSAPPALTATRDSGWAASATTAGSFPTEGCWEVTGTVGPSATLTFVTFVIAG